MLCLYILVTPATKEVEIGGGSPSPTSGKKGDPM
jgi:hypothetical protein